MKILTLSKSDIFSQDEQDENTDLQPIVEHKSPIASQSVVVSPGKVVQAADDLVSKSPLRLQVRIQINYV